MAKTRDIAGQRFGRWIPLKRTVDPRGRTCWECRCDCGTEKIVNQSSLVRGLSKSCGCLDAEQKWTHGLSRDAVYHSWDGMIRRCYNSNDPKYYLYGGRGIRVCVYFRTTPRN